MTADLERIAREAGDEWDSTLRPDREFLERFARAVASECAKVCEEVVTGYSEAAGGSRCDQAEGCDECAQAIRARFGLDA